MYICGSLLAHHRVIRNIPDFSFTFTESLLGETALPSEAILRVLRLYPLIVISPSSDYILKFLRVIYNISGSHAFT